MAVTAAPYGLIPVKQSNEAPSAGTQREFRIASGAAGMFFGTPVRIASGNLVPVSSATFGSSKADLYVGVFQGCVYTDSVGNRVFSENWPNGQVATNAVGFVAHDPETLFMVQASTANFDALSAVGTSYGLLNFASGNTATGRSTAALDIGGRAAGLLDRLERRQRQGPADDARQAARLVSTHRPAGRPPVRGSITTRSSSVPIDLSWPALAASQRVPCGRLRTT